MSKRPVKKSFVRLIGFSIITRKPLTFIRKLGILCRKYARKNYRFNFDVQR